jgi:hypothetical protein
MGSSSTRFGDGVLACLERRVGTVRPVPCCLSGTGWILVTPSVRWSYINRFYGVHTTLI